MTVRDRRHSSATSAWVRSFACEDVKPLIVCRGPIRREAIDVFRQMGITRFGILLSEKDSIVYTHALAPELRVLAPEQVHRVKDYTGASKEERVERMNEIVRIAQANGYTHVFAGYGFMAEDPDFVRTLEEAGLCFIGPASSVQRAAGLKDEAKRTALDTKVSVTPGVDDVTRRVVLRKWPTVAALRGVAQEKGLALKPELLAPSASGDVTREVLADAVLAASYAARLDLYSVDELCAELSVCAAELLASNPGKRIRLKAIGGGGGKGQRILAGIASDAKDARAAAVERAAEVPALAREVLGEVKAGGVGDNKNILLELNIEQTRHNEIQLIGNGQWCLALGGRDCSLQMHEQKLLEVSVTQEALEAAIAEAKASQRPAQVRSLEQELASLQSMEAEAERFGAAVGLNSASTFECIVENDRHYFMEVNTRIQVEHRVTELCYGLRFQRPDDPSDAFEVTSLVECMVLLARHGARLPKPTRIRRQAAAVEARLNATNRALEPHAGGTIISWNDPVAHEIRDDQGICEKNPDSGLFMRYRLAGAYDSNVALLVTYGGSREESYRRLAEILRCTVLRGADLSTNLEFHYGLVHWFLARDVWAKPTTRFVGAYLAQVGLLAQEAGSLDVEGLWADIGKRYERWLKEQLGEGPETASAVAALKKSMHMKETLVGRVVRELCAEPHLLSAWLSHQRGAFERQGGTLVWRVNPIDVLADTYWLLHMERRELAPPAHVIWDNDAAVLERAQAFYRQLSQKLGTSEWPALVKQLASAEAPSGFDAVLWAKVRSAHLGFQSGLELLAALVHLGERAQFDALRVEADGSVTVPERLLEKKLQDAMRKVLAPPPAMSSDQIVAVSGGMFYAQEAPDRPPFVQKGSHFKAGDPLYLIEVMKMFNRVTAPFAGTVEEILVSGGEGAIVHKGQPLFRVTPDEPLVPEDVAAVKKRRAENVARYSEALFAEGWVPGR